MFGRLPSFLKESREELRRVIWPNRRNTTNMVLTVIAISVIVAAFLGALDFVFLRLLEKIIV